ncbi:MAG: hypothetical protein AAF557_14765 [Pseudomonadota bacterium]
MTKGIFKFAAVLVAFCGTIGSATAQNQNPVGQWFCEWGFQNTAPGKPANAVGGQFNMVVYQNGTAQGQGLEAGSAGQFQMTFQGQWQVQGRKFEVVGQKNGGLAFGPSQMNFGSSFTSATTMALTENYANGQVYASQCRRSG